MKKLLTYILRNLVDHPDELKISVQESETELLVNISVHQDDLGRVIGKGGRTINAIRALAKVLATKEKKLLTLTLTE